MFNFRFLDTYSVLRHCLHACGGHGGCGDHDDDGHGDHGGRDGDYAGAFLLHGRDDPSPTIN